MAGRLIRFIPLACCLAGGNAAALAQLADPTRPPAAIAAPEASPAGDAVPATSGLQSVILKKHGRPAALINGVVVELGGMVGEARLVKVDEDAVVLLGPQGRETLRLIPAAEKQMKVGADKTAKPIGMNAVKGERR